MSSKVSHVKWFSFTDCLGGGGGHPIWIFLTAYILTQTVQLYGEKIKTFQTVIFNQ